MLIPAATLEDFPSDLSDYDARSLLAAWSVLWHPSLLAQTEQIPAWYRADGPPEPPGRRLIAVGAPSLSQLPDGYETRCQQDSECRMLTGASRSEMLAELALDPTETLTHEGRAIGVEDFFAAGYAALQVQVMTRRLRYTSNLDEVHLQSRIVAGAKAFLEGDAMATAEALHDVFDCLAEERDHYFSSDPHLIDLTLAGDSTLDRLLEAIDQVEDSPNSDSADGDEEPTVLATPWNVLIDRSVADAIASRDESKTARLKQVIAEHLIGWAGGGPAETDVLDAMTFGGAASVMEEAHRRTSEAIGVTPPVYGRLSGSTPSDMTGTLVKLGYVGMIPLDFAGGTGHGDEAKVVMQSAGKELEALTAKPIDASGDASFLTLGTRLGEAIDSGEIATALLVHWPGQSCESFGDLQRVASWSLTLGRFWKLDDYFQEGEHPYHHGTGRADSPEASRMLNSKVEAKQPDPISEVARQFQRSVEDDQRSVLRGMAAMVGGDAAPSESDTADVSEADRFAAAIGAEVADEGDAARLLINPHALGCRDAATLVGSNPSSAKHIFASSTSRGQTTTTVDIPACGFVTVRSGSGSDSGDSLGQRLRQKFGGGPKLIAEHKSLQNEFMEVAIHADSGGVAGVYSGARGNRFSMRLIRNSGEISGEDAPSQMRCKKIRVTESTAALGCIEATGEITDGEAKNTLASFTLKYSLRRGSRFLRIDGELKPESGLTGDPWHHYFAARAAVVTEAAICRSLLRDKLHRCRSRRLVAPLGFVIDEAERETLVASAGLAFHRRVKDRFFDTLVAIEGESNPKFTLYYGFDVPNPVGTARTLIAPPTQVPVVPSDATPEIGWIVHAAPKDLVISTMQVSRRNDGKLAAILRVIKSSSQSGKVTLRFYRDVQWSLLLDGPCSDPLNLEPPPENSEEGNAAHPTKLDSEGDRVSMTLAGHGVADMLVVF